MTHRQNGGLQGRFRSRGPWDTNKDTTNVPNPDRVRDYTQGLVRRGDGDWVVEGRCRGCDGEGRLSSRPGSPVSVRRVWTRRRWVGPRRDR